MRNVAIVGEEPPAFTILRFPEQELPDVVYLEQVADAVYVDKRERVDQCHHVMERICACSATCEETAEILGRILDEW